MAISERIRQEVTLLRTHYPELEFLEEGQWVRFPSYHLSDGWKLGDTEVETIELVLQFPPTGYPQNPFYGFYVPSGLRYKGTMPTNFTDPAAAQPPFSGTKWAFFSGNPEPWVPSLDISAGSNVLSWVHSIGERLREGV